MKRLIINTVAAFLQLTSRISIRLGISRPKVVYYMDGGICSQMSMYLRGQYYKDVAEVLYDTTWFELCGKDMDGRFDRKLELLELFPALEFKTVTHKQKYFYKMFYRYSHNDGYLPEPGVIKRTTYFGGYYDIKPDDLDNLFSHVFGVDRMRVPEVRLPGEQSLGQGGTKVAVHVRRGDLANREFQWYKSIPNSYFFNAIKHVEDNFNDIELFFFSDEPEWVEKNLCPFITAPYHIIQGNKAYEDLYLISQCNVVIASQGSFGVWGAKLNGNSILIKPSNEYEGGFLQVTPSL